MMRSHQLKQTTGAFVAVTAMAALSAYCTTKFLVRVAVDRKSPHVMEKAGNLLSRTQKDDLFLSELDTAAKRLEEKENETVKINAADGVALVRTFYPLRTPEACGHRHARLALFLGQGFRNHGGFLGG